MANENLWGDLRLETIRTPATVLREQAERLTNMTKGTLKGHVRQRGDGGKFIAEFSIWVQALAYFFEIGEVRYDLALYPAEFLDAVNQEKTVCKDEAAFQIALRKTLTSASVQRALTVLAAQARE